MSTSQFKHLEEVPRLEERLSIFVLGHRVSHYPAAHAQVKRPVLVHGCPYRHGDIRRPVKPEPAYAPCVDGPRVTLQLVYYFHGPYLRRSRDRASGEYLPQG